MDCGRERLPGDRRGRPAATVAEAAARPEYERTVGVVQRTELDAWGKPAKASEWRAKLAEEEDSKEQDD